MQIEKAQVVKIRDLPNGNERFVQDLLADDPSMLALGPLVLHSRERTQPSGGRLDLLLRDQDGTAWYEVEVQLGETDASHIIRTIEYWDVERRRYPNIRHTAVIVAEEITSRFFNVISLFNQSIPIVALKLTALKVGDKHSIICTKILDYQKPGVEEEDSQITTRDYWMRRSAQATMALADQVLTIAREVDPKFEFVFAKSYITVKMGGQGRTFLYLIPQKKQLKVWVTLKSDPALDQLCQDAGIDPDYSSFYGGYQFDFEPQSTEPQKNILKDFISKLHHAILGG